MQTSDDAHDTKQYIDDEKIMGKSQTTCTINDMVKEWALCDEIIVRQTRRYDSRYSKV
ncbi:hypothetical protein CYLTODRAFT_422951 [Cylindrobasidium torrendii FP15055 ss-10]|uniref:Uncharacterized protein n=1 Tax=Cylindrobasidium torrendii FP15055 ss-10 TaxID=1314674 RepID=A0A0D7B8Y1_9AGAR|nr:hypothetical protein CYLTODRAFT_422951 [Cylindrobasidium torrendii FP15055 ss-10]